MTQGKFGDGIHILLFDGRVATPGRMGAGGAQPDQVGAQAIDAGGETALGNPGQRLVVQGDAARRSRAARQRSRNASGQWPTGRRRLRVAVERQAPANDLLARLGCRQAVEGDVQAKAVEQLRAQLALLRVHGADQHEARAWRWEMPSRSMRLVPLAATSSSKSTRGRAAG
jgi:hypothetical protein